MLTDLAVTTDLDIDNHNSAIQSALANLDHLDAAHTDNVIIATHVAGLVVRCRRLLRSVATQAQTAASTPAVDVKKAVIAVATLHAIVDSILEDSSAGSHGPLYRDYARRRLSDAVGDLVLACGIAGVAR